MRCFLWKTTTLNFKTKQQTKNVNVSIKFGSIDNPRPNKKQERFDTDPIDKIIFNELKTRIHIFSWNRGMKKSGEQVKNYLNLKFNFQILFQSPSSSVFKRSWLTMTLFGRFVEFVFFSFHSKMVLKKI